MLHFTLLNSIGEIRAAAPEWNDLWQRSDCTSPLARAEMVAHWLEHFASRSRVCVAAVADGGRWLAALPLIERRMRGVMRGGALPCNEWPSGATLLWDAIATAAEDVGQALIDGLSGLPWQLVNLEAAMPGRASWRALHRALAESNVPCDVRTRWHVGRQNVEHDFPALLARLSRKHRQRLASSRRKLAAEGEVEFELHKHLAAEDVESLLGRFLTVEDRGWKGKAGSSIVRTLGAAEFLLEQARSLAVADQLWLGFLRSGGRDVAACYQILGKGVLHSFKIGYNEDFARFSPGHLLHYHLLEAVHADPGVHAIDYIGAMTEYHASWRPETYPFARLAFSLQGKLLGRAMIAGYQWMHGPTESVPVP